MVRWNVSAEAIEQRLGIQLRIVLVQRHVFGSREDHQPGMALDTAKDRLYFGESSVAVGRAGCDHDRNVGRDLRYHVVGRMSPGIGWEEYARPKTKADVGYKVKNWGQVVLQTVPGGGLQI